MKNIAGEAQVPPDAPVAGRERAPEPDVSGSTGRRYGCRPALSVRQDHHRSRRAWSARRFTHRPASACVAREVGYRWPRSRASDLASPVSKSAMRRMPALEGIRQGCLQSGQLRRGTPDGGRLVNDQQYLSMLFQVRYHRSEFVFVAGSALSNKWLPERLKAIA